MYGYKMGDVSPPAHNAKLKIIYGSKMNETANLDTTSIHIHIYIHNVLYIMYMVGGYSLGGRGRVPPAPPK